MPRFLSDVPHDIYRRRAFAIAAIVTGLFLILFASLPLLFRSNPFLSLRTPAYEEIATEVLGNLVQSSSFPLLIASIVFSIWGVASIFAAWMPCSGGASSPSLRFVRFG